MTNAADMIVTALQDGPSKARDLSYLLDGVSYANVRQILGRMTRAGTVTKVKRGIYALPGAMKPEEQPREPSRPKAGQSVVTDVHELAFQDFDCDNTLIAYALASIWEDFEARNDLYDERAWV